MGTGEEPEIRPTDNTTLVMKTKWSLHHYSDLLSGKTVELGKMCNDTLNYRGANVVDIHLLKKQSTMQLSPNYNRQEISIL